MQLLITAVSMNTCGILFDSFRYFKSLHMITSKSSRLNFSFLVLVILSSCGSGSIIHYLGNSYPPTTEVKEYFDEQEITSPYRVIGTMTNDKFLDYDVAYIRQQMILKAREVGADGIVYAPVEVDRDHKEGDRTEVKAKLLKFE
jgi:hypothetical protein